MDAHKTSEQEVPRVQSPPESQPQKAAHTKPTPP